MDSKYPKPPPLKDLWGLVPRPIAAAVLGVLDAAFDRRPPFDAIPRSAFDMALGKLPPPPGLTREQARRAVFEEMNFLPWSEGLEPPEGGSWARHAPMAAGVDRVFVIPFEPYRLKRKVAKVATDRMRADGALSPDVGVDLSDGLSIHQGTKGDVRARHSAWAAYRAAPFLHSKLSIYHSDRSIYQPGDHPLMLRPKDVFLDPNLGDMTSDEEAEQVIRQVWRYGDALYRALVEALPAALSDAQR